MQGPFLVFFNDSGLIIDESEECHCFTPPLGGNEDEVKAIPIGLCQLSLKILLCITNKV